MYKHCTKWFYYSALALVMSLGVENIRQWCANASTETQDFPPGPAYSTEIRLLTGAKLFCLTNEVRWRRGVAEENLKFLSWKGRARADRIRMPLRIRFSIERKILFSGSTTSEEPFFFLRIIYLFFVANSNKKMNSMDAGPSSAQSPYWRNGWVV